MTTNYQNPGLAATSRIQPRIQSLTQIRLPLPLPPRPKTPFRLRHRPSLVWIVGVVKILALSSISLASNSVSVCSSTATVNSTSGGTAQRGRLKSNPSILSSCSSSGFGSSALVPRQFLSSSPFLYPSTHVHLPFSKPAFKPTVVHQNRRFHPFRPFFTMAWRSSGNSNEALVQNLARNGLIGDERVREAMLGVDRAHYAPSRPYEDSPQSIGYSATISAPHMHAHAATSLISYITPTQTNPSPRVLDVGSGSGYLTHVLANLVGPTGSVIGIDHIPDLVSLSRANVARSSAGRDLLETGQITLVCGDGRRGHAPGAPYDAIHVGAAAVEAHEDLIGQLKSPGRLFIPIGPAQGEQDVWVIDKDDQGRVRREKGFGVRYVPLTDRPE